MSVCPTCGQKIPGLAVGALLDLLTNGVPHREVYRGRDGGWYVTYGGGETTAAAVVELVKEGLIHSVYNNIPNEVYHVGKTIDQDATLAARKDLKRKDWKMIYVQDAP